MLEPSVLAGNGFEVQLPEWANMNGNGHTPKMPGIFSDPVRLLDERAASMETNPEKILKAEFTK
jgi:hypothetical protein